MTTEHIDFFHDEEYKPWTREFLRGKGIKYFLKHAGEKEYKEVTLDEYADAAEEHNKIFGEGFGAIPKVFRGAKASGHIDPELLKQEGIIV